ncbi:hypothetical protein SAMN04487786_1178 [Paenisporosarcina quisquiliarum]|nr:hypothetical protein SAMN04487786_1178 [Paenisporosarcina quisquiliarum]
MKTAKNTLVSISFILYLFALVFILFLDSRGYRWSDLSYCKVFNSPLNKVKVLPIL